MCQVCKYSSDHWSLCCLFSPTFLHQLPGPTPEPDLLCIVWFGRSCTTYHTTYDLILPKLLVMERVQSGEYFVYHHPQSVDIRRSRRPAARFPELHGIQQLRGHVGGCAATGGCGHLSWSTRCEGRESKVGEASLNRCFVCN